jgi:hypothetical protein
LRKEITAAGNYILPVGQAAGLSPYNTKLPVRRTCKRFRGGKVVPVIIQTSTPEVQITLMSIGPWQTVGSLANDRSRCTYGTEELT